MTLFRSDPCVWWTGPRSSPGPLFARPPLTIADFTAEVAPRVAEMSDEFVVTPAGLALNIHPAGVNKGTGLEWLAQVTGIDPVDMGGIGDSAGDVDFLRLVGHAGAPANATREVKRVVDYISAYPDVAGLLDILEYWSGERDWYHEA